MKTGVSNGENRMKVVAGNKFKQSLPGEVVLVYVDYCGEKAMKVMYQDEITIVSHREFSTGFYYDNADISRSSKESYSREFVFLGAIGKKQDDGTYLLDVKNQITTGDEIEYIGPDMLYVADNDFILFDKNRVETDKTDHCKTSFIKTSVDVKEGYIIRKKAPHLLGGNR